MQTYSTFYSITENCFQYCGVSKKFSNILVRGYNFVRNKLCCFGQRFRWVVSPVCCTVVQLCLCFSFGWFIVPFCLKSSRKKTSENLQPNKDCCASRELKFFVNFFPLKKARESERVLLLKIRIYIHLFLPFFLKNWNSKWIFIRKQEESLLPTHNLLCAHPLSNVIRRSSQAWNVMICGNRKMYIFQHLKRVLCCFRLSWHRFIEISWTSRIETEPEISSFLFLFPIDFHLEWFDIIKCSPHPPQPAAAITKFSHLARFL